MSVASSSFSHLFFRLPSSFFTVLTFAWLSCGSTGAHPSLEAGDSGEKSGAESADSENQPRGPHEEITVTATRNPTPVRELGRSVSVVSRDEIRAIGATSVKDVLELVPGVSVAQAGSYGGPTSVFVRGGESDFNLVLIDGVQVNRLGGEFDFANLSTANVERIEIVRGPASVLYGTEAVACTIHVITRTGSPAEKPEIALGIAGGSEGSMEVDGSLAGGSERIGYAFGAQSSFTEGALDFNSQYQRTELSFRGSAELSAGSFLNTSLRFNSARQHFPTDDAGQVIDPNDYRETQEQSYAIDFRREVTPNFESRIQYGYFRHDSASQTIEDGITDFYSDVFEASDNRHSIDWQNNVRIGPENLLTFGAAVKKEETEAYEDSRRSSGVYFEDRYSFGRRLFVTGGVRFDDNNRFASFVTGQLDASLHLTDKTRLRGAVGNGFRAPAFSEILGFPEFGILGNPGLRPERNTALELGGDFIAKGGRRRLSATLYFGRFRDLIEFTFLGLPGTPNFINVEAANSDGVEIEGINSLSDSLVVGGHYTFNKTLVTESGTVPYGNFEDGLPLLRRPRHFGGLYFQFNQRRFQARFDLKAKGSRDDRLFFPDFSSRRVELPAYGRLDCRISIPLADLSDTESRLAFTFRVENITGHRYAEIAGFPSPGRRILAGLEYRY